MVVCYQVWQSNFRDGKLVHEQISWGNPKTYDPDYLYFTAGDMHFVCVPMAAWRIKSQKVIYKSEYSKVCKIIGHQLPQTQQEENYCQAVERDSPDMAKKTRDRMISELDSLKKK